MALGRKQHLMADIEAGKIDVIVIYKIDRLTRLDNPRHLY